MITKNKRKFRVQNPFAALSRFERGLWMMSVAVILGCGIVGNIVGTVSGGTAADGTAGGMDPLSTAASLVGVTALIFVAKGMVTGQVLTVVFAVFYGIISYRFRYFGEMITYLCMTAPMAMAAVISWLLHPYTEDGSDVERSDADRSDTDVHPAAKEVAVSRVGGRAWAGLCLLTALVTVLFYFILRAMGNASLAVSTVSVTTSFLASALTFMRSPYYALAYAANDIVLIVLWSIAAASAPAYLSMVFCFLMFFFNDLYGFYNWKRMERRQTAADRTESDRIL